MTTALLAIEPPRMKATYTFDDFWMVHVYVCRHCAATTASHINGVARDLMDDHLGQPRVTNTRTSTATLDI